MAKRQYFNTKAMQERRKEVEDKRKIRDALKAKRAEKKKEKQKEQPPSLPVTPPADFELKKVMGINVKRFIKLVKERVKTDDLHQMVDVVQAEAALHTLAIVENIQKTIASRGLDVIPDAEKVKMLNAIKGAIASANDTFKALGISKISREAEVGEDGALTILLEENIEKNLPPELEKEYIAFQKDIEGVSPANTTTASSADQQDALSAIKKPIENNEEELADAGREDDVEVIRPDRVGIKQLG